MIGSEFLPCAFEQARHVEGGPIAGDTYLLNFDAGKRGGLRKLDDIAHSSENFGAKERARRMKVFAETLALFSLSGSVPLRLMKSTRHFSIFSALKLRSLMALTLSRQALR